MMPLHWTNCWKMLFRSCMESPSRRLRPQSRFALIQAKIEEKEVAEPIPARVIPLYPGRRIALAASIVLLLCFGTYLWTRYTPKPAIAQATILKDNDVPPGHNGAVLTLASGRQIILDSARNGSLASDGSSRIVNRIVTTDLSKRSHSSSNGGPGISILY